MCVCVCVLYVCVCVCVQASCLLSSTKLYYKKELFTLISDHWYPHGVWVFYTPVVVLYRGRCVCVCVCVCVSACVYVCTCKFVLFNNSYINTLIVY